MALLATVHYCRHNW